MADQVPQNSSFLTEDDIDDLLYFARVNDIEQFTSTLNELSAKVPQSESLEDKLHAIGLNEDPKAKESVRKAAVLELAVDEHSRNNVVHYAGANGHTSILELIIPLYPSTAPKPPAIPLLNAQNSSGNTPLHWAALSGHLDFLKLAVNHGGDITLLNKAGHDVVVEAEMAGKDECVQFLLGCEVAVNLEKGVVGREAEEGPSADANGDDADDEDIVVRAGDVSGEAEEVDLGIQKGKDKVG